MIEISIQNNATSVIREVMGRLKSDDLNQIVGRAGANVVKTWFRALESERPNALGGKRTHFWAHAAAATGFEPTGDGAKIYTESTGVLYQRYGGTLKPSGRISSVTGRPITHLAIPARAEAHGKLPSDFNNLVPLFRRRDGRAQAIALVEADSQDVTFVKDRRKAHKGEYRKFTGAGQERGGLVLFWLVKQAEKGPDEGVLPPEDLVRDSVQLNLLDYVIRNARRIAAA